MKTIADPIFLTWAADGGLVPDPRYPASRQQLVFVDAPDCWRPWSCPTTPAETAAFVGAAVGIVGRDQPWRVRLRGGGQFAPNLAATEAESNIAAAVAAAGLASTTRGAVEFDSTEQSALVQLAVAFALSGYRIETDLEIVNTQRDACLLFDHHRELIAQFSDHEKLDDFRRGMTDAGFPSEVD
jgi:hypothetical protein